MSFLGYTAAGGALGAVIGHTQDRAGIGGLIGLAIGAGISSIVEPSTPAGQAPNNPNPNPNPQQPPKKDECGWGDWLLGNCGGQSEPKPADPDNPAPANPNPVNPNPKPANPNPVNPQNPNAPDPNPPEDPGPNQDYFYVPEYTQEEDGWPADVEGWSNAVLVLGQYMDSKLGPFPAKNHAASSMLAKAAYNMMANAQIWPKPPFPPVNDSCKDPNSFPCKYLATAYNYFLQHEI